MPNAIILIAPFISHYLHPREVLYNIKLQAKTGSSDTLYTVFITLFFAVFLCSQVPYVTPQVHRYSANTLSTILLKLNGVFPQKWYVMVAIALSFLQIQKTEVQKKKRLIKANA